MDYLIACLIMGLGIGVDVAIATFMRAHTMKLKRTVVIWVVGVTSTHTLFPMIGYLLTYFSLQALPVLTPIIGVIAFMLIAHFLIEELRAYKEAETNAASQQSIVGNTSLISFGLILAVSWDALWSGPAKSAQVLDWSQWMIWLSFILVGLVVLVFCLVSLFIAKKLTRLMPSANSNSNSINSARLKSINYGLWVQYSVICYFGLLALFRYTFSSSVTWVYILLFSFLLMFILLKVIQTKVVTVSYNIPNH
ncbi:MAG: putative Mn2+ efflux pump MntP [Crocinitomicaceae bacterium]|jgi:putative Mn2+ efflux pump MntP